MKNLTNGHSLAALAWLSVFVLAWLMITERTGMWPDALFLLFFLAVALVPSVLIWHEGQKPGE